MSQTATTATVAAAAPTDSGVPVTRHKGTSVRTHFRRILVELLNLLLNHAVIYWLIGFANKRLGLVESVFLVYPASEKYALAYVYPCRLAQVKWNPRLGGLLYQNGRITIMFVISATESDFRDEKNTPNLAAVADALERIRLLTASPRKTFAGILPGVLSAKRIIADAYEADLTAQAVVRAIDNVREQEKRSFDSKVVVLGGKGFIGRRVVSRLQESGASVASVDIGDSAHHLTDGGCPILINVTNNGALAGYVDKLSPGTIVLNEVYPEPNAEVLRRMTDRGVTCYHVVGIRGRAIPSFPAAYRGAIPCCAAWPSKNLEVCIRKLV